MYWIAIVFLVPSLSLAKVHSLKKEFFSDKPVNVYEPLSPKQVKKLSPLSKLKYYETRKMWKDCVSAAPSQWSQNKSIQGWIMLAWLGCALKLEESDRKAQSLKPALNILGKNVHLMDRGPWKTALIQAWIKALTLKFEGAKNQKEKEEFLELVYLRSDLLNSEQKNFFQLEVGAPKKKQFSPLVNPEEKELDEKIAQYQSEKKKVDLVQALVSSLKKFPGSLNSKKYREMVGEELVQAVDRKESWKDSVLSAAESGDPDLLSEWAALLHRRAFYSESVQLAEKALDESRGRMSLQPLYLASRCYLFMGDYDRAKKKMQALVESFPQSEEAAEILFRLGLLHFRLSNHELAKKYFEILMASGKDKTELNTRYWWIRTLEALGSENAALEKKRLLDDFPFSYYGLKMKAEMNQNWIDFSSAKEIKMGDEIRLYGDQEETWKRFSQLSKAGWWSEAQAEALTFPWNQKPEVLVAWVQYLVRQHQYPLAIRLLNQAMEQNVELRSWGLLKSIYPNVFLGLIEEETKKYNLNPILIQSLIRQESAFGVKAVSTSNALGLMQMIPPTAAEVAQRLNLKIVLPEDMYLPEVNIPMGTFYYQTLLDEFQNNVPLALAAYNAGPSRLKIWLKSRKETENLMSIVAPEIRDELWYDELPWSETSFYVKAILRNILLYRIATENKFELKAGFWSDLVSKKKDSDPSIR